MSWRSWICFLQWIFAGILCVVGMLVLSSCGGKREASMQEAEQQAAWSALISSHTSGVVSRKSAVRIRFATDVAPADGSHPDLRRTVTIEPAVPASIAFEGSHQIVLEPKSRSAAGHLCGAGSSAGPAGCALRPAAVRVPLPGAGAGLRGRAARARGLPAAISCGCTAASRRLTSSRRRRSRSSSA